jgi:hypothetical protein
MKTEFDLVGVAEQHRVTDFGIVEATEQHRETEIGVTFYFDHNRGIGSKRESSIDTYKSKKFSGVSLTERFFDGPLISPTDLVNITAQLNTYVKIAKDMEEF